MKIVIEQSTLQDRRITYQGETPYAIKCRKCKKDAVLIMQVQDEKGELIPQRPDMFRVWPHDASVISIYLCTECGSMRARWNQG